MKHELNKIKTILSNMDSDATGIQKVQIDIIAVSINNIERALCCGMGNCMKGFKGECKK